jgi:hypothetical protein
MYSHSLPAIHKKFAFEFLGYEQGKYQIALNTKLAKEGIIPLDSDFNSDAMEVDYERSEDDSSDKGKYSPFLNQKTSQIMSFRIPKTFQDPYKTSLRKPVQDGKKSIIKVMKKAEQEESIAKVNPLGISGM